MLMKNATADYFLMCSLYTRWPLVSTPFSIPSRFRLEKTSGTQVLTQAVVPIAGSAAELGVAGV